MKPVPFYEFILIDVYSSTPKYLQLANSIIAAIESAKIGHNYLLPSINELSYQLEISRDTAEKAYKKLKNLGVIGSVPGKGYFISNTQFRHKLKVFLLFNKLSAHKKIIFDSFVAALDEDVAVDFYIYNNDFRLFKKLLLNRSPSYSHFVIIPHFIEGGEHAPEVIKTLPRDKLILLDKKIAGIDGSYSVAYENFEKDIFEALLQAIGDLRRYKVLKLIFPAQSYYPIEIRFGFEKFCKDHEFSHQVVHEIKAEPILSGDVYITIMEDDLLVLLERITQEGFSVGSDVGVISYNETPLKKILLNGITTISTDFAFMGTVAAGMVMNPGHAQVEVPFFYTHRASL